MLMELCTDSRFLLVCKVQYTKSYIFCKACGAQLPPHAESEEIEGFVRGLSSSMWKF